MADVCIRETVLRKLLDKIIDDSYKNGTVLLKALSIGGANYTSCLYSVTVTSEREAELKLFAKVADISEKLRKVIDVKQKFETELFVYKDLAKIYEKIQEKYDVLSGYRFQFPIFYGGGVLDEQETIVLEDLTAKEYNSYNRFISLDWEHIAVAVESLARFHALSFAFEKEDPDNFAKAVDKLAFRSSAECDATLKESWKKRMKEVIKVAKKEDVQALSKFLLENLVPEEVYKYKMNIGRTVLCHGDYRASNLLFKRQNGELKSIVLDYQTVRAACAPVDLLYLEFVGTDEKFRRENHQRLIDHYYQELTLALDRLRVDVNDVYPRETFDSEVQKMLPVTLRLASFILPWVLMEANQAPQLAKCEGLETIVVPHDQLFAERYSALVSDCVRWGVI